VGAEARAALLRTWICRLLRTILIRPSAIRHVVSLQGGHKADSGGSVASAAAARGPVGLWERERNRGRGVRPVAVLALQQGALKRFCALLQAWKRQGAGHCTIHAPRPFSTGNCR
jgi:hypothetical protein